MPVTAPQQKLWQEKLPGIPAVDRIWHSQFERKWLATLKQEEGVRLIAPIGQLSQQSVNCMEGYSPKPIMNQLQAAFAEQMGFQSHDGDINTITGRRRINSYVLHSQMDRRREAGPKWNS